MLSMLLIFDEGVLRPFAYPLRMSADVRAPRKKRKACDHMLLQIQQIFVVITSETYLVILNNLVNFFRNLDLITETQKEPIREKGNAAVIVITQIQVRKTLILRLNTNRKSYDE